MQKITLFLAVFFISPLSWSASVVCHRLESTKSTALAQGNRAAVMTIEMPDAIYDFGSRSLQNIEIEINGSKKYWNGRYTHREGQFEMELFPDPTTIYPSIRSTQYYSALNEAARFHSGQERVLFPVQQYTRSEGELRVFLCIFARP